MADLTIKPVAAAGNKLILQDQAGGAVLTTTDSGATLGNSTQDNITRLGTVTTGTMNNTIGSSATFPTGHILNMTSRANKTQTHVTGSTYTASDCYHNITTTNGNYVWVMATCPVNVYSGSAAVDSVTMNLQIWHSTDNSSFSYMQNIQGGATTDKQHAMWSHNYSGNLDAHFSKHTVQTMQFLHGPVTGTSQYYKVYLKYTGHTGTGHAAIMNPDSNIWGGMTLMEVQA